MTLALTAELDDINLRFQTTIHALEGMLRSTSPDLSEIARRRAALARMASTRLRFIDGQLCPTLAAGPTPAHGAAARQLRARIAALFVESNRHIGEWNSARIATDWAGYRVATRTMVSQVKAVLAMERRDIYPLLASV